MKSVFVLCINKLTTLVILSIFAQLVILHNIGPRAEENIGPLRKTINNSNKFRMSNLYIKKIAQSTWNLFMYYFLNGHSKTVYRSNWMKDRKTKHLSCLTVICDVKCMNPKVGKRISKIVYSNRRKFLFYFLRPNTRCSEYKNLNISVSWCGIRKKTNSSAAAAATAVDKNPPSRRAVPLTCRQCRYLPRSQTVAGVVSFWNTWRFLPSALSFLFISVCALSGLNPACHWLMRTPAGLNEVMPRRSRYRPREIRDVVQKYHRCCYLV